MPPLPSQAPVIWQANKGPQEFSLTRTETEILYGGSRGGGKTAASIAWFTRWFMDPRLRFLVIRRNSGDLRDWIDKAKVIWAGFNPEFFLNEVRLPSGAKGFFGHLADADAYERYQGHEYQKVCIEELTHIPDELSYLKLLGSCRSTVLGLKPQIFCTTNPGGPGHEWVKRRFVTVGDAMKPFKDPFGNTRIFVPAKVEDNPILIEKDPRYVSWLESLPINLRRAWKDGSWEDFEVEGAYYANELEEARQDGRIGYFPHLPQYTVDTFWDLGMNDATAIWFGQWHGDELFFIDYLEAEGEGLAYYATCLAEKNYDYGEHHFPHDARVRELGTGKSRIEIAEGLGITPLSIVPGLSLEDGIQAVRASFKKFRFDSSNCKAGLDHVKMYRKERDEARNVWKNRPRHDEHSHGADSLRYAAICCQPGSKTVKHSSFYAPEVDESVLTSVLDVPKTDDFVHDSLFDAI